MNNTVGNIIGIGEHILHVLLQHLPALFPLLVILYYFLDEIDSLVSQAHLALVFYLRDVLVVMGEIPLALLLGEEGGSEAEVD